jgi:hypothetical protein
MTMENIDFQKKDTRSWQSFGRCFPLKNSMPLDCKRERILNKGCKVSGLIQWFGLSLMVQDNFQEMNPERRPKSRDLLPDSIPSILFSIIISL